MKLLHVEEFLEDILSAYRVQCLHLTPASTDLSNLDFHMREQLYDSFDYRPLFGRMTEKATPLTPVEYMDDFGLRYLTITGESTKGLPSYYVCGPFQYEAPTDKEFSLLIYNKKIPKKYISDLKAFYERVTIISDMLSWKFLLAKVLSRFVDSPVTILSIEHQWPALTPAEEQNALTPDSTLAYAAIESRYEVENKMLNAIQKGDTANALYYHNLFMGYTLESRNPDYLRNVKDYIIAANTIFRKAVESAYVHPLYIDFLNGKLTKEIENSTSEVQLNNLCSTMIRRYCMLVQSYSRAQYSSLVRDCLNYVDFHYQEPLCLSFFADKFTVSKNYLSSAFHREVGMTLTDYINTTRVRKAIQLLNTTSLSMQAISEECGFSDSNYFTRTFKKIQGMSPLKYRQSLTE